MSVKWSPFLFDGLFRGCCISPHGERGRYQRSRSLQSSLDLTFTSSDLFQMPVSVLHACLTCFLSHRFVNYQPALAVTPAGGSDAEESKHSWWKTPAVFCRLTRHRLCCYPRNIRSNVHSVPGEYLIMTESKLLCQSCAGAASLLRGISRAGLGAGALWASDSCCSNLNTYPLCYECKTMD